jgi:Transposase, Mutator family
VYGAEVSKQTITAITDRVMEGLADWQSRPLDPVYAVLFIDAIVRHEAPFVPSGGERTPPPGCRSSRVKLRAA